MTGYRSTHCRRTRHSFDFLLVPNKRLTHRQSPLERAFAREACSVYLRLRLAHIAMEITFPVFETCIT